MTTNSLAWAVDDPRFVYQDTFRMVFQGDSPLEKLTNLLFGLDGIGTYPSIQPGVHAPVPAGQPGPQFPHRPRAGGVPCPGAGGHLHSVLGGAAVPVVPLLPAASAGGPTCRSSSSPSLSSATRADTAYFNCPLQRARPDGGPPGHGRVRPAVPHRPGPLVAQRPVVLAGCLFYGWGKLANLPVGALCALCLGGALALLWPRKRRKWALGGAALCAVILAAVYFAVPSWMDEATNYNAVFYGVLKDTTPQQESAFLEDLGLPQELAQYADSNYYTALAGQAREDPVYQQSFPQVGKVDVLLFYLRHPPLLPPEAGRVHGPQRLGAALLPLQPGRFPPPPQLCRAVRGLVLAAQPAAGEHLGFHPPGGGGGVPVFVAAPGPWR